MLSDKLPSTMTKVNPRSGMTPQWKHELQDAFVKSRCFARSRSSACQLSKGSVCASLSGAEATVAATMAAVIPFTTIEGVIAALAKIDVMHRHMAASSEGKVRHSRITRARRGVGRP